MFSINDKVVVITGGAAGIGRAIATHFVKHGAKVTIGDLKDDDGVAAEIGATFVQADVSSSAQYDQLLSSAHSNDGPIDVLINNAALQPFFPLQETSDELLDQVLDVNVKGAFYGTRQAPNYMSEKGGVIINLASWVGQVGIAGAPAYNASKAAVIQLTRTAALELGSRNIRAVSVCPGVVMTQVHEEATEMWWKQMAPLGRVGKVEEIASLLHYLSSDEASFISGEPITIDGGMSAGISPGILGAVAGAAGLT